MSKKTPAVLSRTLRRSAQICVGSVFVTTAFAQTVEDARIQDVVVPPPDTVEAVSERQANAFQKVPQAATVITQQQIEALDINNLKDAKKLEPSLQIKSYNVRNLTFNIRGFGADRVDATNAIFGGVPIYIDGIYQPRPGQAVFDIPDLIGVEVLKGPQGTLGGQDSTGGAIYLTTALPSFVAKESLEVSTGNYDYVKVKASATGAIAGSDQFAFRVSVFGSDRGGYVYNYAQPGQKYYDWHDKGARGQILWQPNNDLSVRAVVDFSHVNQACCVELFNGAITNYRNGQPIAGPNFYQRAAAIGYWPLPANPLQRYATDVLGYQQTAVESEGAALIVDYTFNGFHLNSTTAYRGWDFHPNNRNSGIIGPQLYTNSNGHVSPERSIEEEIKITSPAGPAVEGAAGLFFLHENLYNHGLFTTGGQAGGFFGDPSLSATINDRALNYAGQQSYDNPRTDQIAPYVRAVWHATPELDVTTGLRYSYYEKAAVWRRYIYSYPDLSGLSPADQADVIATQQGFFGKNREFSAKTHQGFVSALASVSYKFTPDIMGYATYSLGGRGGGPNVGAYAPDASKTVKPEELSDYEIGLKSSFFDGKLIANLAGFIMVDRNYITRQVDTKNGHPTTFLGNAKRAISKGVELDLRAQPFEGLSTFASFVYDNAYYASFSNAECPFELGYLTSCNLTGKRLALTPKFSMSIGGEYSHHLGTLEGISQVPLVGYFGADVSYQTNVYSTPDNSIYAIINPYALLNLHVGIKFEDGSWDLQGWVKNATNKHYFSALWAGNWDLGVGEIGGQPGEPLFAGMTIRAKF